MTSRISVELFKQQILKEPKLARCWIHAWQQCVLKENPWLGLW